MFKVPLTYEPKFRHHNKSYPLTRFKAYLISRGLNHNTVKCYISAMRRMLAHLGEGQPNEQGQVQQRVWEDWERIRDYRDSLRYGTRSMFDCSKSYWSAFIGSDMGPTTKRDTRAVVAAATRILLACGRAGRGVPEWTPSDLAGLLWEYDKLNDCWYITHMLGSDRHILLGPGVRVLGNIIRDWGYQATTAHGHAFLPGCPDDWTSMPMPKLYEFLKLKITPTTAAWLTAELEKDYENAITPVLESDRIVVPDDEFIETPAPRTLPRPLAAAPTRSKPKEGDVVAYDEELGNIRVVNGKLVCDNPEDPGPIYDGREIDEKYKTGKE